MKKKEKKGMLANVWYMCKFAWQVEKAFFFWKIFMVFVQAATPFITIFFLRYILDAIMVKKSKTIILSMIIGMAFCVLLAKIITAFLDAICSIHGEIVSKKVTHSLGLTAARMPYSQLENPHIKDTLQNAQSTSKITEILDTSALMIQHLCTMLGTIGIIISLQPLLLILVILVAGLKFYGDKRSRDLWEIWRPRYAPIMRKIHYINDVIGRVRYAKEVRLNHLQNWLSHKWDQATHDHLSIGRQHNKAIQRNRIPGEIASIVQEIVLYVYLAWEVVFGYITVGDFSMYLQSIKQFIDSLLGTTGAFSQLLQQGQFIHEFRICVELAREWREETSTQIRIEDFSDCSICFQDVCFQYPASEDLVLNHINITIPAGKTLSIVGQNGAGKTTFVKLLCRFYQPTFGKITINGVDIQTIPYEQYVRLLGVVFQDFCLFAFSIEDNIRLNLKKEEEAIHYAIEKSGIKDKISSLEQGLQTAITRDFDENGMELSGGESQKLVLARAIYKNAPIMILDEPTSALDPAAEYDLYQRFHQMVQGKTAIYISHRLSSTRFTDQIAVFENGKIVEYGTHNELLMKQGTYADMFQMQAEQYQLKEKKGKE